MRYKAVFTLLTMALLLGGCAGFSESGRENGRTPASDDTTADGGPATENATTGGKQTENDMTADDKASDDGGTLPDDPEDAPVYVPSEPTIDVITYTPVSDEILADDGTTTLLYVSRENPTIHMDNADAADKILSVFSEYDKVFEGDKNEYVEAAKDEAANIPEYFNPYSLNLYYENQRVDDKIISVHQNFYSYMNGAHGLTDELGLNFDAQTGDLLSFSDIAADETALFQSIHDAMEAQLSTPANTERLFGSFENAMAITDSIIKTDGSLYFTERGLTVIIMPYNIGPYASGTFYFDIPYEDLRGLKEEYAYSGTYQKAVPIGMETAADLDGDGTPDNIFYDCRYDEEARASLLAELTINDTDFSELLEKDPFFFENAGSVSYYYIVDLDASDSSLEIAISDAGSNDYRTTYFLRYDGKMLTCLGSIQDFIDSSTCTLHGDGSLDAAMHIDLLETHTAIARYAMDETGTLKPAPCDWYEVWDSGYWSDEFIRHNLLSDVTVHTKKSLSSGTVVLTPDDGPVRLPATDNEHWYVVETADGTYYYLYLEDFSTTEDGRETMSVFENLLIAG